MRLLFTAILSTALAGGVCAQQNKKDDPSRIGDRDVGKCLNFYSVDKEIAWGKQLADEVARESKMDDDPILSEYINRMGQNLARNSDAKTPFTFRVIDGDEMNAFALPGGYVFVNTGLIKLASDEDELAGALAHEIAHVAARHMTCRASKAQVASGATLIPGVFLGGWSGLAAHVAASAAIPMTFLSFSRHDESEADFLGVQYMYAAGYDPSGAVSILEKLEAMQKTKPGVVAKVFATHPMSSDRIAKTEAEVQRILPPREEYVVTTSEYQAVRERLLDQEIRRKAAEMRGKPGEGKVDDEHPTLKRYDLKEQRHIS